MFIALKTKIWSTVFTIVLLFTFFSLYYFPAQQGQSLLKNYNNEVANLAKTVALGVKIALNEQNYEGVQTAMEFVKGTPGLKFVSLLQIDTVWDANHSSFEIQQSIFGTYPEGVQPDPNQTSTDSLIVKLAPFTTHMMTGAIMVGCSTDEIIANQKKIRRTSLLVSGGIFLVGMLIGFFLSRNISVPVRALRDAARRVGEGDLSTVIKNFSSDEIGELSKAFNNMVQDLSKARAALNLSNQTLSETNKRLNDTLDDLKSTQTQLIQSEKMASLGELTAGIAHEIQNPLNFVNNFSEINVELIDELEVEIKKGNTDEVIPISSHIKENHQKISFHGKRADAIVKGMLQHSRSSSGVKEPTDINALADEFLRLAYHGLRARDKSFTATIKTDFDENLGKINVVPQDLGRVMLNLITNAFYSVSEKARMETLHHNSSTLDSTSPPTSEEDKEYEPTVTVTTRKNIFPSNAEVSISDSLTYPHTNSLRIGGQDVKSTGVKDTGAWVEISIKDNGSGIPKKFMDKIFQPFFTTKPTGKGTGLGLSLSYDIIKAHGGDMKVETKEGEFAEFIIILPL